MIDMEQGFVEPATPGISSNSDNQRGSLPKDDSGNLSHAVSSSEHDHYVRSTTTMGSFQFRCNKWILTALVLLLGSVASSAFLAFGINATRRDHERGFQRESAELAQAMKSAMRDYELFGLWIHESCVKSGQNMNRTNTDLSPKEDLAGYLGYCSRDEFHHLYQHIASVGLDFNSIQFLPNVTHEYREEYERQERKYYEESFPEFEYPGIQDFAFTDAETPVLVPRDVAPSYFPVTYVEPEEFNLVAVGIDVLSTFQTTLGRALTSWKPAVSDPIKLLNYQMQDAYAIVLHHPGVPVLGHSRTSAVAQVVIRLPDFLRLATTGLTVERSVYLYVTNTTTSSTAQESSSPLFMGAVEVKGSERNILPEVPLESVPRTSSSYVFQDDFPIVDRQWIIVVESGSDEYQPDLSFVIAGGIIMFVSIVLLAAWIQTSLNRVARVHQIRSEAEAEKSHTAQRQARAERELNEYLAHELRNPLSAAVSALSFVKTATQDSLEDSNPSRSTILDDVGVVESSLEYMDELLRNILDVHRATYKKLKFDLTPTNVANDVLKPVASVLFMRDIDVDIQVECHPQDLFVKSDRMRLKQIVLNIATNATKCVDQGFLRLRGSVVDGATEICVEDSGPGVPPEKRGSLFETYQENLDMLNQGTGIGLSVCKKLCNLMDADIFLDESYDSGVAGRPGARFVVRLNQPPLDVSKLSEADKKKAISSRTNDNLLPGHDEKLVELPEQMSVLFVDDDPMLRKMFTRSLERIAPPSWHIEKGSSGEAALKMVESRSFDLIFMDQYMASVEKQLLGTETVRMMRSKGVPSVICGLSANDMKDKFLTAGADAFMSKPFPCDPDKLKKEICRILQTRLLPSDT